jgi:glutaredoxin-related protein
MNQVETEIAMENMREEIDRLRSHVETLRGWHSAQELVMGEFAGQLEILKGSFVGATEVMQKMVDEIQSLRSQLNRKGPL